MTRFFVLFVFLPIALFFNASADTVKSGSKVNKFTHANKKKKTTMNTETKKTETAILAGGCFWGVEELIRSQAGVISTQVGYTGGTSQNPTYEIVKKGTSGHAEAIQIEFDPQQTSYEKILKYFFKIHDPTTKNQQGNDIGTQYRSAIFYLNPEQEKVAKQVKEMVDTSGAWKKPLVTDIVPAGPFYSAESYHQDYLQKNPNGYTCHFERNIQF
ncbi:MAG: peptide-methionine (S)-S-oxide reductase MsrA [Bdellovibrionaceae bacterium]|nr:peptide-methionine (S)-S-oxide reductase MsrA [Pseudobdellovibrionaceae bacterium]